MIVKLAEPFQIYRTTPEATHPLTTPSFRRRK